MHTEPSTGLTPEQLAYTFGFRASSAGKPATCNPYPSARDGLGGSWHTGWLNGQGKNESDLAWYIHVCRGGD